MVILHGLHTLASANAEQMSAQAISSPVMFKANADNSGTLYVGDSTVTTASGFPLAAGDQLVFENLSNLNNFYLIGTSGDKLHWISLS